MTTPLPPIWVMDTECYRDYFLVMFRHVYTRETIVIEHPSKIIFPSGTIVTFNGVGYDFPMISVAMRGASTEELKGVSDSIILRGVKPWQIEGADLSAIDHIDLMEVAPGLASLKTYGGRINSKKIQDLPIDPSASISPAQRLELIEYCSNDLDLTIDLYHKLKPQLDIRIAMSQEFGIDLRSKSDAQMGESIIRSEVEKILGHRVYRPELHPDFKFKFRCPSFISFQSAGMQRFLSSIREMEFTLAPDGSITSPPALDSMHVRIGDGLYKIGIGGMHSMEKSICYRGTSEVLIKDRDVKSYYPRIILNQGIFPPALGPTFLTVYGGIVALRLAAKDAGDKVLAEGLKVPINGPFGKLNSKWSVMYAPDQMVRVTLIGQLSFLMLIERLAIEGFNIVSANTDGIVTTMSAHQSFRFTEIIKNWEIDTGFETEETNYSALYSKDVNDYVAIKADGSVKTKGLYATSGMQKNPTNTTCVDAVIGFLSKGIPIEETIRKETDINKFLTLRKVEGGASYRGEYIGKTVRWYYAKGTSDHIEYVTNGHKVPRSEGAKPMQELLVSIPSDLNYAWYINEAKLILNDIGAL